MTFVLDVPLWVWWLLGIWVASSIGVTLAVGHWLRFLR
jgi:hypothetical protein